MKVSTHSQKALITGASGSIGLAIANELASAGWQLALFANHNPENCADLRASMHARGLQAAVYQADLSDSGRTEAVLDLAISDFGHFDALINNAGVAQRDLLSDIRIEDWDRLLQINLRAAFQTSKRLSRTMIQRHSGVIINVSSVWGRVGAAMESSYAASKAGLIAFGRSLAKELGPSGIRVNTVCPGVIRSAMNDIHRQETLRELAEATPLGRLGDGRDVACLIRFLCSDEASFITGQCIDVDGGFAL